MKRGVLILALVLLTSGSAQAIVVFPDISLRLHEANVGIDAATFDWAVDVANNRIDIWETWSSDGPGLIEFRGLIDFENYTVTKHIINNTGEDWDHFANELLDPTGQGEDIDWDIPIAGWVPTGFSHSNDRDGLSFAQNAGIPRTSLAMPLMLADEFAGIDFIDFYGGIVSGAGGLDEVSFGLRTKQPEQQPFLLAERPNTFSVIPEPGTLMLLGLGLASGMAALRRRRSDGR